MLELEKFLSRIKSKMSNIFVLSLVVFLVWMLFFDNTNFITTFKLNSKLNNLEKEKEYYEENIQQVEKDRKELLSNTELLEKFARERYFMKKESEDLYIIVDHNE
ncbi:septum formation initiator family protein [Mangrovivirga sp. M17]|uniref:Septum formation initiator family protein n=1 Tax=Mangrovivirga halotolerans TaxID=2993936 RepID=A0ABT3RU25_9BACT|nr:septum formation initiator family protein [Mangrovivirga halotolerans]MCX2745011.1 septum formation initiator family protein [Mangrovivirga halotolerans]